MLTDVKREQANMKLDSAAAVLEANNDHHTPEFTWKLARL